MNNKLSNDENIRNLKKRKILRYVLIVLALLTIVLSLLSIFNYISFIFPLITFILYSIIMRIRENIKINKVDDLKEVRKALNKSKK